MAAMTPRQRRKPTPSSPWTPTQRPMWSPTPRRKPTSTSTTRSNICPAPFKTTRTRTIDPAVTRRPFNFRLERVRALRESFEDQAREELAASMSIRLKGEAMLRAASERHAAAHDTRRQTTSLDVTGHDLIAAQAYVERTSRAREAAELELGRREAE